MITSTIFPGRYVQGAKATKRLGAEMSRFGNNGYIVCDPFVFDNLLPGFRKEIEAKVEITVEKFEGECSDEEIDRLAKEAKKSGCDFVAGIGGGKTLDTMKAVAHQLKKPVVIVPTLASTDAPCSALSVIYTSDGAFKRYLFLPHNPDLVLVDTEIIASAPVRFLRSGMGDALSTWFEAESCHRTVSGNMTGDAGSMTALALSKLCYDTLLEYGQAAMASCEAHAVTPALDHIVEANTLLSGLGFESGGLAACHSIHNGLTVLKETHSSFHGEKVAFGVLATLFLTDRPWKIINEVYSFCLSIGLPVTFDEIGLKDVSDEAILRVGVAACAEGETIYNEAGEITPSSVAAALRAADNEGRRRKSHLR